MGIFHIDADNLEWICGTKDDPNDLCLHGHVTVQIGSRSFADDGTISATGLYLLKSLKENKIASNEDIQMIPCCGHFMIANDDLSEVAIIGCDNGTDWSIIHKGDNVQLILPDGYIETVTYNDYKKEVLKFVDKVKAFYASCQPKLLPDDEFERNGYIAFWNEWNRRYQEAKSEKEVET